jgi:hypothetical protein
VATARVPTVAATMVEVFIVGIREGRERGVGMK